MPRPTKRELIAQGCYGNTPIGTLIAVDVNSSLLKFRTSGIFTVSLRLTAIEAAPLIEVIDARMDNVSEVTGSLDVNCPYEPEDGDTYLFRFSNAARGIGSGGTTVKRAPGLWDGNDRKLPKFYRIPPNSAVRVGKQLPLKDVAGAGGWKDVNTLLNVYQQSDAESMLAVTSVTVKLRERGVA